MTHAGLTLTFSAAAIFALAVLAIGHRVSINFAAEASVDAAPFTPDWNFPACPDHDDGPVTVTIKYTIAKEDRERFYALMQGVQAAIRRNGAFDCRLDESLDNPGLFRLEFQLSTWADHLRQTNRMTVDDRNVFNDAWDLHASRLHSGCSLLCFQPEMRVSKQLWFQRSDVLDDLDVAEAKVFGGDPPGSVMTTSCP